MSKNFEEEYKALASEDLPDLWNRIEAGLTERTTALTEDEKDGRIAKGAAEDGKGRRNLKKVTAFLYKYRTVAAAALCAVVIIPAAIFLGRSGRNKSWEAADDTAQAEDTAMYEAAAADSEEAAPEEAVAAETDEAAAVTEDYDGGAPAGGAAKAEDASEEGAEAVLGDQEDGALYNGVSVGKPIADAAADMAEEESRNGNAKKMDDVKESSQESGALQESAMAEMAGNKTVRMYEQVTVKVIRITEETVQTDRDFFYGIKVKVVKDPSGELAEGEEITVWISMLSSQAYLEGEEYTLNLSYEADRECPYRIA